MAGAGNYNVNQAASGGLQAAQAGTANAMGFNPSANVQQHMNPYTDQVINTSLADLGRANDMALDQVSANATQAGAWGGSRHGVAEAETNRAFMDQAGRMASGLRQNAFTNAQNMNMQGANFRLGAANQMGNLAGQAFNTGRTINQDMMRQGMMQQAMQQQLIDAAKSQYAGYASSPQQSLQLPLQALGTVPVPQSQTQSSQPGLFDYLSLGTGLVGGFL